MVKFAVSMRVFYKKRGVTLPKEMTHNEFKLFLRGI